MVVPDFVDMGSYPCYKLANVTVRDREISDLGILRPLVSGCGRLVWAIADNDNESALQYLTRGSANDDHASYLIGLAHQASSDRYVPANVILLTSHYAEQNVRTIFYSSHRLFW